MNVLYPLYSAYPLLRWRKRGGAAFIGALEDYASSLTSSWSVCRRLVSSHTGNIVRVRRSGDNAESDFGFDVDGALDSAAMVSWVVAGGGTQHGYVTTVYDQLAGAPGNLSQTTAARQPRIVISGVLQTASDGRARAVHIPSSTSLPLSYSRASADFTAGGVMGSASVGTGQQVFSLSDYGSGSYLQSGADNAKMAIYAGVWNNVGTFTDARQAVSLRRSGSNWTISKDASNVATISSAASAAMTNPIFGSASADGYGTCGDFQDAYLALSALDDAETHAIETSLLA